MRSLVHMIGLLRGMGREVPCEMLAIREQGAEGGPAVFTRCSVIETAEELPDGDYTVAFERYIVSARKDGGLWIPADAAVAPEEGFGKSPRTFSNDGVIEMIPLRKNWVA